jgi:hypothetical protein
VSYFLPLLLCSAILLCFYLFYNSSLLLSVLQFYSASICSAVMLCFKLFCNFSLTSVCSTSLSFISHYAYCNFTFLTVQLIFLVRTTNLPQSLRFHFILYPLFSYTLNLHENASATKSPNVQEL